jgi:hypothetical protein
MRATTIHRLIRLLGLMAAVLLAAYAATGPSASAHQDAPGNNGTVKIHDGAGEPQPSEVRNEPHVCTFHLHFYFADPEQSGTWEIQEWAPTGEKGTVVLNGTYDTAGDGEDRQPETGTYSLPDGHYKLFWDGDLDTGKHDKMKVFWVDCAPVAETPSPTGSELPEESGSASPSETATATPTETASATPTGSELPEESGSASPTESETATATPTGSELPIPGTPSPSSPGGAVLGATGTPNVTPPATDVATTAPVASSDGGRLVALGLAGLIAMLLFLTPRPRPAAVRVMKRDRSR